LGGQDVLEMEKFRRGLGSRVTVAEKMKKKDTFHERDK